jgi:hypothetical protein
VGYTEPRQCFSHVGVRSVSELLALNLQISARLAAIAILIKLTKTHPQITVTLCPLVREYALQRETVGQYLALQGIFEDEVPPDM